MAGHVRHRDGRPPSKHARDWVTARELADALRSSLGFAYELARAGKLASSKIDGCRRWPVDQVAELVASCEVSAKTRKPTSRARAARRRLRKLIKAGA